MRWQDEYHAWDADEAVYARNLDFERRLEIALAPYAPQQNEDDSVPPVVTAILKFGVLPGLAVWLIFVGVTEVRSNQTESLQIMRAHDVESRQRLDRLDRLQERMLSVLLAQCVNAAKDTQERNACLRAGQ